MKIYKTRDGDKYHYEFGKYYTTPCIYVCFENTRVPYRYSAEYHEYWIYVQELDLYRCNVSML